MARTLFDISKDLQDVIALCDNSDTTASRIASKLLKPILNDLGAMEKAHHPVRETTVAVSHGKKRKLSAATRKKLSEATKLRWRMGEVSGGKLGKKKKK